MDTKKIDDILAILTDSNNDQNIQSMIENYDSVRATITEEEKRLEKLRRKFNDIVGDDTEPKSIDDKTFSEYMTDIEKNISKLEKFDESKETDIDKTLIKFKKTCTKIKSCQKYLRDKKLSIVYTE